MSEVYIYAAQRTPVGAFNGVLASIPASHLGSQTIASAVASSGFSPDLFDNCIMGS